MSKKEARLLRVGVLGAGPIAQAAHFEACCKARNAELYAMCDRAEDLVTRMAAIHQPRVTYTDYDAMLADPQVEAVIIAVADQFHIPLAQKALAAGKHVLIEKPLGVNVEECESLRIYTQRPEQPLVVQIGNNRRFDPGVTFAQRFIQEELGQLQALKAWYYDSVDRYTMTDNLQPLPITSANILRPAGNPKADRQRYFLLTHGIHLVDTVRFLGGALTRVHARFQKRFDSYCWFIAADFANGSLGHLDLIVPIRGDFEEGFQVFGEYGSVNGHAYLPWFFKAGHVECFSVRDHQYRRVLGEDAFSYKLQIESFADTILHDAPQLGANLEDGIAAVRTLVAIARSAESDTPMRLDEVSGNV